MPTELDFGKMTVTQKLQMLEGIWDDHSRSLADVPSPDWHGDILAKRIKAVEEEQSPFQKEKELRSQCRM
ncbi:MAG: addiction module protein [Spirulina sp.]